MNNIQWVVGGLAMVLLAVGSYLTTEIIPTVAALEAQASHILDEEDAIVKKLDLIYSELSRVNIKLARIETTLRQEDGNR